MTTIFVAPAEWFPLNLGIAAVKVGVLVCAVYFTLRCLSSVIGGKTLFTERRACVVVLLTSAIVSMYLGAVVIRQGANPFDRDVLEWLRNHSFPALLTAANIVTLTGSWMVLVPVAVLAAGGLIVGCHHREARYVAVCTLAGIGATCTIKLLIGRERPALWDHADFWGSSFPSGHTLNTSCVAGALAVCAARIWPCPAPLSLVLAAIWIALVGLSRMILGVHWPTDVAAAATIGVTLTAAIHLCIFKCRRSSAA